MTTSWNPYNPCSVGDLRLPAQFQPVWYLLFCDTKAGHPTRAWVCLPNDLVLSVNSKTDPSCEVEIWRFGAVTLTRSKTLEEIDAYWESDWA